MDGVARVLLKKFLMAPAGLEIYMIHIHYLPIPLLYDIVIEKRKDRAHASNQTPYHRFDFV